MTLTNKKTSTAPNGHVLSVTTSASGYLPVTKVARGAAGTGTVTVTAVTRTRADAIQKAVFAHIQAMRALGRLTINTAEVARAIGVPLVDVEQAVESLKTRGVKIAK